MCSTRKRGIACDKGYVLIRGLPEIQRRRAEMEREGIARAEHAPAMADQSQSHLAVDPYLVPTLTVTPIAPLSDIPHVFVHGGAWCMGSSLASSGLLRRMAHQCRRPILSLDYPLAPEHPYPAAIDATARAIWALAANTGIAGVIAASAGCHIALAALLRLQHSRDPRPPGAVLLWNPALTLRADSWSHHAFGEGFGLTSAQMRDAYDLYAVPKDDPHGDVAAMELAGLPPVWIACGDRDPLLDDSLRAFEGLTRAQCDAHLEIVPGAEHGFMNQWFEDARAEAAITHALDWLEARCCDEQTQVHDR